jgi:hypothetical protein
MNETLKLILIDKKINATKMITFFIFKLFQFYNLVFMVCLLVNTTEIKLVIYLFCLGIVSKSILQLSDFLLLASFGFPKK